MSAILSTKFRTLNASRFFGEIANSTDNVYIGVGKADPWDTALAGTGETIITPTDDQAAMAEAYRNLIGMVRVPATQVSHVVPRHDWSSGATDFVQWDSNDPLIYDKKFYCLTDNNQVYKLIVKGSGASTDKPTHTTVAPVDNGDGYSWKYMYTIDTTEYSTFLTDNYMPVQTSTQVSPADARYTYQQQSAGTNGSGDYANPQGIEAIVVTDQGSGYSSPPTVTITGDGIDAQATAVMAGAAPNQVVESITIDDAGSGYTVVDVEIDGNAVAYGILAPGEGHGADPVEEMGGFYVEVNATLQGDGGAGDDLTIGNDFRQITLIRNPLENDGTTAASALTYNPVTAIETATASDAALYSNSEYITGQTSGAVAYVVRTENDTAASPDVGYIYITQNSKTGYEAFDDGENIVGSSYATPVALAATAYTSTLPEVEIGSGDILFLENRAAISRSSNQTEDVKLVIEF